MRWYISERFYEIEMLSATAWLFRGRTEMKTPPCSFIWFKVSIFDYYEFLLCWYTILSYQWHELSSYLNLRHSIIWRSRNGVFVTDSSPSHCLKVRLVEWGWLLPTKYPGYSIIKQKLSEGDMPRASYVACLLHLSFVL